MSDDAKRDAIVSSDHARSASVDLEAAREKTWHRFTRFARSGMPGVRFQITRATRSACATVGAIP